MPDTTKAAQGADGALAAQHVSVRFDGLVALEDVDIELRRGEILGLIGPNGAGKTTLFNVLTGFQAPTAGRVVLDGDDVTGRRPEKIARYGLARTFQAVRLFRDFTVLENAELAAVGMGLSRRSARLRARQALELMDLTDLAARRASELAYGDERRVGIARALAIGPKYLLLDEPAAGMNEQEAEELAARVRAIREQLGCGILVIEHNMAMIMQLCDHVQVLEHGRSIGLGTPADIARNPDVRQAYLGSRGKSVAAAPTQPGVRTSSAPILAVSDLAVSYGPVAALRGISLHVGESELVSVVGPNGAGKSTLMHAIAGIAAARRGDITFAGERIVGLSPEERVRKGIALVPEGRRIFTALTVAENLIVGGTVRRGGAITDRVLAYFPILRERHTQVAGRLSGGEQQQLAIARALRSNPRLLLLDEPSLGLASRIIGDVYEVLGRLVKDGVSILVVEQSVARAFTAAGRSYVLRNGLVELEGPSHELATHAAFDTAYFGFGNDSQHLQ